MSIRLYIPQPFVVAEPVRVSAKQAHYLCHVMRLQEGASITVFNNRDGEWQATLGNYDKKGGWVHLKKQTKPFIAPPEVRLLFAPIKSGRIDYLIEKATELGVTDLYPVLTDRTVVRKINFERLEAHAIEAAEQCERMTVPKLYELQNLTKLLSTWDPAYPLIVGDERGGAEPIYPCLKTIRQEKNTPVSFLIGPEGGFSNEEFSLFQYYGWVKPVSLGDTILRADTAALMALSVWRALMDDSDT